MRVATGGPPELYPLAQIGAADGDDSLVDLLDRLIDRGVVIKGDVVLAVAGVDLVHLRLQLALTGIEGEER
jgi:hypothetical protein